MTSLTPHKEVSEKTMAEVRAAMMPYMSKSGQEGVNARISYKFIEAAIKATYDELDFGITPQMIMVACGNAIAHTIVNLCINIPSSSTGPNEHTRHNILEMVKLIQRLCNNYRDEPEDADVVVMNNFKLKPEGKA